MNRTSSPTLARNSTGWISVNATRTSCTTAVRLVSGTVGLFDHAVQPDRATAKPIINADRIIPPLRKLMAGVLPCTLVIHYLHLMHYDARLHALIQLGMTLCQ